MPKVCFCVSTKIDKESPAEVKIASRRYPRRGELRAMRECQSRSDERRSGCPERGISVGNPAEASRRRVSAGVA
jgi:hypothetical protein